MKHKHKIKHKKASNPSLIHGRCLINIYQIKSYLIPHTHCSLKFFFFKEFANLLPAFPNVATNSCQAQAPGRWSHLERRGSQEGGRISESANGGFYPNAYCTGLL